MMDFHSFANKQANRRRSHFEIQIFQQNTVKYADEYFCSDENDIIRYRFDWEMGLTIATRDEGFKEFVFNFIIIISMFVDCSSNVHALTPC